MSTFQEINQDGNIDKEIRKAGLSLAVIFSKEDIKRFGLDYGDVIRLNSAEIIKKSI